MRTKIRIGERPNYYNSQLLLEDDFFAEQDYHSGARRRHNRHFHGWGVLYGLQITTKGGNLVAVSPGMAIDPMGREISVEQPETVDLTEFGPNETVKIGLSYMEEGFGEIDRNRIECYAVLMAVRSTESCCADDESSELILATIQLDGHGKVQDVSYTGTRYAYSVRPGSISAQDLAEELQKGWVTMPFRPLPIPDSDLPKGVTSVPEFRIGVTMALSPGHKGAGEKDEGAGGTMAIPIPPNIRKITRFRVAGQENEGEIFVHLYLGGWDPDKKEHYKRALLDEKIGSAPFLETFSISDPEVDPEYHTLSLSIRGTRRTAISLIGVEFSYV
ncbi:MAG: hypothetical protein ABFS02_05330 [Pseudomonadota bacterium]